MYLHICIYNDYHVHVKSEHFLYSYRIFLGTFFGLWWTSEFRMKEKLHPFKKNILCGWWSYLLANQKSFKLFSSIFEYIYQKLDYHHPHHHPHLQISILESQSHLFLIIITSIKFKFRNQHKKILNKRVRNGWKKYFLFNSTFSCLLQKQESLLKSFSFSFSLFLTAAAHHHLLALSLSGSQTLCRFVVSHKPS